MFNSNGSMNNIINTEIKKKKAHPNGIVVLQQIQQRVKEILQLKSTLTLLSPKMIEKSISILKNFFLCPYIEFDLVFLTTFLLQRQECCQKN
jgi:hypothetical protein